MNLKYFLFLTLLIGVAATACRSEQDAPDSTIGTPNTRLASDEKGPLENGTSSPTPSPRSTPPSTTVSEATLTELPESTPTIPQDSSCEADKWQLIPTEVYEYSVGEGWKVIVIPFAVYNGSSYWGSLNVVERSISITTGGGFTYPIYTRIVDLRDVPVGTPYSGAWSVPNQLTASSLPIPPNFYVRGTAGWPGRIYGNPDTWHQLVFRVAETQNHFTIHIPRIKVSCILEGGQLEGEDRAPITLDLDKDVRAVKFPTDTSDPYEGLGANPVEWNNTIRFEFTQYGRANWGEVVGSELDLYVRVTNLHQGFEVSGSFHPSYLIGSDGLIRTPGCDGFNPCNGIDGTGQSGRFRLGPGQSGETAFAYLVDPTISDLMFVWIDEDENYYQVFSFSPATATGLPAVTLTPSATPAICSVEVRGTGGSGLMLREDPGGDELGFILEGETVTIILEELPATLGETTWVKIRTASGREGWVVLDFLFIEEEECLARLDQ